MRPCSVNRVAAAARLQRLDIIRDHALKKTDTIFPCHAQLRTKRQVDKTDFFPDRTIFFHRISESFRQFDATIVNQPRAVRRMPGR
jgi:hypothetical protein